MSREEILTKIKNANSSNEVALPTIRQGVQFEDPIITFGENIKLVGGNILAEENLENYIIELENDFGAMKFLNSYLSTDFKNPLIPIQMQKPHDSERLDILIIEGKYGIAENGAIWVEEPELFPRSALFLAQHLIIFLKKSTILHNLHNFYNHSNISNQSFGVLISGPSKTADVEQCLVIGAHGPRSLGVVLAD